MKKKEEEKVSKKEQTIIVYQFNDQIGDFDELITDPEIELKYLLYDDFILLFIDPKHYRVWLWYGYNITPRMKFIATKKASKIASSMRDKYEITFKIIAVDQYYEILPFKVMLGIENDFELLESLSREKN